MKRLMLPIFLLLTSQLVRANDTLLVLSEEQFIQIVRTYHPIAKQAQLLVDRARADLVTARAGFDPMFTTYSSRKTFDGKVYYDYTNPEVKIPTWYGIQLKAGLEENLGTFINPENSSGQSSYLGISMPLARNLLIDKRRAVLRQARIFRDQSKADRLSLINDLLNDAYDTYWFWVRTHEIYRVLEQAVNVSQQRFELVKLGVRQGDRPAIDTTEALAQLQTFQLARNEALLENKNAGLSLSNFLWSATGDPYILPGSVLPDSAWRQIRLTQMQMPVFDELLNLARTEHPKISVLNYKLDILDIEKKLKFQNLLPTFNIKYNLLSKGYEIFNQINTIGFQNNYAFGFDLGLPLRLSQGRGEYAAARIKLKETGLDLMQTRLSIDNKVKIYFNELGALQTQIGLAEANLENYQRLLRGEENRFQIGESSLFLVNARENKVLESQQKLAELKTKFLKTYRTLSWAAGQLR